MSHKAKETGKRQVFKCVEFISSWEETQLQVIPFSLPDIICNPIVGTEWIYHWKQIHSKDTGWHPVTHQAPVSISTNPFSDELAYANNLD